MTDKLSKNQLKMLKSLQQKKYRDSHGLFLVEGVKMVREAFISGAKIEMVVFEGNPDRFGFKLPEEAVKTEKRSFSQFSSQKNPSGIAAVCSYFSPDTELEGDLVLALDRISDPGNLGTLIRLADWFGVKTILCDTSSVDQYNPKVVQASMGSLFRIKIVYDDLEAKLNEEKGKRICLAADMEGESVYSNELKLPAILLLGSESHGIRPELLAHCHTQISIPRIGKAESLNVATAGGILMAEFRRRT